MAIDVMLAIAIGRRLNAGTEAATPSERPGHLLGHPAGWRTEIGRRHPGEDIAHFQAVARAAEKALLDAVFQADSPSFTDTHDVPTRSHDPIVLATAAALVTERVGFILTASTTFNYPYNLARQMLSLDHLSKGRVGWNIVTTANESASGNSASARCRRILSDTLWPPISPMLYSSSGTAGRTGRSWETR
jgi:hypothetical protein